MGLVHEIAPTEADLQTWKDTFKQRLNDAAPTAVRACKSLIFTVANVPISSELIEDTSHRLAKQRMSKEGVEGLEAFLQKRAPAWKK